MKIEILQQGQVVETKEFGDGSFKIGRAKECDIYLKSPQVSKQHALLVIKAGKAAIVDVGSSNGVFINGILVRKQRIEANDTVEIGDFQLRLARPGRRAPPRPGAGAGAPAVDGNLAVDMSAYPETQREPELTPQEKFVVVMEEKVFQPFLDLLKVYDWRWVLGTILLIVLIFSVIGSILPVVRWGKKITTEEAVNRAHAVLTQVVRENYRVLTKTNDLTRLTVEAAENVEGMLLTYVVDSHTGNILAPAKFFNNSIKDDSGSSDPYAKIAMERVLDGGDDKVSVDKGGDIYIVAQPIPFYDQEPAPGSDGSLPTPVAIALAYFKVPDKINSTFEPLSVACLIAVLLSLLAFLAISKMMSYPVIQLNEQLDAALKGDPVNIECQWKFPELQTLATVINFSVSKMKQATGGGLAAASGTDTDAEDESYLKTVAAFDYGTSDAIIVLDKDKKVKFVGKALEELINLRPQYAMGQNISDACRDQSFAGTAIDLSERVISSLGENQNAQLDINGINRTMVAVAHRNTLGEIRFILLTVKLA